MTVWSEASSFLDDLDNQLPVSLKRNGQTERSMSRLGYLMNRFKQDILNCSDVGFRIVATKRESLKKILHVFAPKIQQFVDSNN